MKRYLIITAMLLGAASTWAQSNSDKTKILNLCLTLPQETQYYQTDPTGQPAYLYAVDGKVSIAADLGVNYFGKALEQTTSAAISGKGISYYFTFNTLVVGETEAAVTYDFTYQTSPSRRYLQIGLTLKKTGEVWNITETKIARK